MTTVYVTAPPDAAERLATTIVEERLAACVNHVPCGSVYRWDGEVHHDEEVLLFVKTTDDAYPALLDRLNEIHPHETPAIERFDADHLPGPVATWLDETVGPDSSE